jgi:hypothetical protein
MVRTWPRSRSTSPTGCCAGIDRAAEDAGETREEFLRRITEEAMTRWEAAFRQEIEDMLGPSIPMGGNAAEIIREMRDQRLPPSMRPDRDDD